jgi:hypothetical protein
MSAIWRCRRCGEDGQEERYGTDEFMAHLREHHKMTVISVDDGILIGSTYVHEKGPRPSKFEGEGQTQLPF